MEPCWTVTIGFTFFDLAVRLWIVCQEKSSLKKLRVKGEAISAARRPPGFHPIPQRSPQSSAKSSVLEHEGMVGRAGNAWIVVLDWD
jgi:hypothetical protein